MDHRPTKWTTGRRSSGIYPGDTAFLLRQKSERGLIAHGRFTSEIFESPHYNDPTQVVNRALIDWDTWLPLNGRLRTEDLMRLVPEVKWNYLLGSGVKVKDEAEAALEGVWERHVAK